MYFAGIDIGSTTTKVVIIDEEAKIVTFKLIDTLADRRKSGKVVLEMALNELQITIEDIAYCISTGYGRKAFMEADDNQPEIICHAVGTKAAYPKVLSIIDIGGQDSKVIELDTTGSIVHFEMNDKCAAGTGRFFEVLTGRLLNISMDKLGELILQAKNPCQISSMCTIFAETEIISYLSSGCNKEDVAAGMSRSVVQRISSIARVGQVQLKEPVVFTGGVANNKGVRKTFEEILKKKVVTVDNPQSVAAYGAAVIAQKKYIKIQR